MTAFDYLIVGGGLQGGLLALAIRHRQPTSTVALVERDARLGGNHTWSFHSLDVPAEAEDFVAPLIEAEWPAYLVRFPGLSRRVESRYASISSERFARMVAQSLDATGCMCRTGAEVVRMSASGATLADGSTLTGRCVVDARGPSEVLSEGAGFQKFVGIEVETETDWPDALPTLMDATVPQDDGFRFIYALPFSPRRVLIEDTYFSDSPTLDYPALRTRCEDYLAGRGVRGRIVREESGVLPMPWMRAKPTLRANSAIQGGYAGGWFHPATGYSLPLAVRFALAVAECVPEAAAEAVGRLAKRMRARQRFARFLNRLLFRAVVPDQRWRLFRRLYRALSADSFARFYALEFTVGDARRMILGWPPPLAPLRLFRRPEVRSC